MTAEPQANAIREYRAAGGIVLDGAGRVLLIERLVIRNGDFAHEIRLPKGHVETGETDEQAALREVGEETGYCGVAVTADLGEGYTQFVREDIHIRRCEHYYLMRLTDPVRSAPDLDSLSPEELLFEPRWVAGLPEAEQQLTFESERRFVRRAIEREASQA
jgi:8-oxo-dGTP pyrophosphatase MutT (NUDIX family)